MGEYMSSRKARFNKVGNDLFWEIWDDDTKSFVKWMGYDDTIWWNNVATANIWCQKGKYILNPFDNTYIIIDTSGLAYRGYDIDIYEMPQGCVIERAWGQTHITISSVDDAKALIESLNRYIEASAGWEK